MASVIGSAICGYVVAFHIAADKSKQFSYWDFYGDKYGVYRKFNNVFIRPFRELFKIYKFIAPSTILKYGVFSSSQLEIIELDDEKLTTITHMRFKGLTIRTKYYHHGYYTSDLVDKKGIVIKTISNNSVSWFPLV